MVLLLTITIALISIALILIILVQNPKGGGLSSAFGGSQAANQMMGAANSTDLLEKTTWGLAAALLGLCLFTGVFFKGGDSDRIGEDINTTTTTTTPAVPTPGQQPVQLPGGGQ